MKITKNEFETIKKWIYRNARFLDITRWQYHFENGTNSEVLKALLPYQNEDGGFGNALEADSWNPNSSPYTTSIAIGILDEIKFNDGDHPVIRGIIDYISKTEDFVDGYWPAVIKSNNDYPHAPWWTATGEGLHEWGYTPTGKLAGFVIRYADKNSEIYIKAVNIAKDAIDKYLNGTMKDGRGYKDMNREGEVGCYQYLIESIEITELGHLYKIDDLKEVLTNQVNRFIEKDTSKWSQYCHKPSSFISSPDSILYKGNEEIMEFELNYIVNNRNEDGVWNIVWNWGAYEKEFEISKNWWKGCFAINNTLLMRNFNKLE